MPARKRRVLIVDDVADQRALVRVVLQTGGGWTVVGEAADGREAIEGARVHRPDVVLLDLEMPWVDGVEALPEIRDAAPDAFIVAWTASADGPRARGALELGAAAVLSKTYFEIRHLGRHLAAICDQGPDDAALATSPAEVWAKSS